MHHIYISSYQWTKYTVLHGPVKELLHDEGSKFGISSANLAGFDPGRVSVPGADLAPPSRFRSLDLNEAQSRAASRSSAIIAAAELGNRRITSS
jgi:hypothetical protein